MVGVARVQQGGKGTVEWQGCSRGTEGYSRGTLGPAGV